jgi:hypothetical protein
MGAVEKSLVSSLSFSILKLEGKKISKMKLEGRRWVDLEMSLHYSGCSESAFVQSGK